MKNKQPTATFCITGALEKYKRVDAIVEIHNKTNARFVSGVSSRTDYLISSRKDTSKAKKAKAKLNFKKRQISKMAAAGESTSALQAEIEALEKELEDLNK